MGIFLYGTKSYKAGFTQVLELQWKVQCQSGGNLCTPAGLGGAGGSQSLKVSMELMVVGSLELSSCRNHCRQESDKSLAQPPAHLRSALESS